jgi:hypothetical protein
MTDPHVARVSFQEEVRAARIKPQRGTLDEDLYYHEVMPDGQFRATYVTLEGKTVTALVMFGMATTPVIDGHFCFAVGYAVPEEYRNQGRAKKIVESAIQEIRNDMPKNRQKAFHVEAIVGEDSIASQRAAK